MKSYGWGDKRWVHVQMQDPTGWNIDLAPVLIWQLFWLLSIFVCSYFLLSRSIARNLVLWSPRILAAFLNVQLESCMVFSFLLGFQFTSFFDLVYQISRVNLLLSYLQGMAETCCKKDSLILLYESTPKIRYRSPHWTYGRMKFIFVEKATRPLYAYDAEQ